MSLASDIEPFTPKKVPKVVKLGSLMKRVNIDGTPRGKTEY